MVCHLVCTLSIKVPMEECFEAFGSIHVLTMWSILQSLIFFPHLPLKQLKNNIPEEATNLACRNIYVHESSLYNYHTIYKTEKNCKQWVNWFLQNIKELWLFVLLIHISLHFTQFTALVKVFEKNFIAAKKVNHRT